MINFSAVSRSSVGGKLLRLPLRFLPAQTRVRILQGPLKGWRWIAGAGNHGYWLGSYESEMQQLFAREVMPGAVVYDVGANVGFYTLLASHLAGPTGRVMAFEPSQRNLLFLRQHLTLNNVENVKVVPAAVGDRKGKAAFDAGSDSSSGHLASDGEATVDTIRMDDWIAEEGASRPGLIKIDVEGGEAQVLEGAYQLLSSRHPTLLLATHGDKQRHDCMTFLRKLGYEVKPINAASNEDASEFIARSQQF